MPDDRQYVPDLTPDNCQYVHKIRLPASGVPDIRQYVHQIFLSGVPDAGAAFFAPDNCQYVVKKILSGEPGRTPAPVPGRRRRQPR